MLDRASLERGEADYLDVLGDLISRYESEHLLASEPTDAELLAHLLEARNANQSETARGTGIATSTISAVLAGKRKLTRQQIEKLAIFFHVAPAAFYRFSFQN